MHEKIQKNVKDFFFFFNSSSFRLMKAIRLIPNIHVLNKFKWLCCKFDESKIITFKNTSFHTCKSKFMNLYSSFGKHNYFPNKSPFKYCFLLLVHFVVGKEICNSNVLFILQSYMLLIICFQIFEDWSI